MELTWGRAKMVWTAAMGRPYVTNMRHRTERKLFGERIGADRDPVRLLTMVKNRGPRRRALAGRAVTARGFTRRVLALDQQLAQRVDVAAENAKHHVPFESQ